MKLVLDERGSEVAGRLWDDAARVVSSRIAYAEGRAVLALARRSGRLPRGYQTARGSFDDAYDELEAVDVSDDVVRHAGDLAERHALRGYDAVHLASALAAAADDAVLVTWDDDLGRAARAEGLAIVP